MKRKHIKKTFPELTQRRKDFCRFYVIDPNGLQSAIKAGFSEHTAQEQSSRLLSNVKVQAEISRLRKAREDRLEASADFVVRELMRIAKFDIRKVFDHNGDLKKISAFSEDEAKCIASVEVDDIFEGRGKDKKHIGYTRKVRCWDKKGALELLGEHFGIFKRGERTGDQAKEDKQKKLDILQVIKLVAKDGQTTIVSNRITDGTGESPVVDTSCPRGLVIK